LRGERTHLSYTVDIPPGARLGARAAEIVLWVTLARSHVHNTFDRREIVAAAWRASEALDILDGTPQEMLPRADEYACAVGGVRYLTFGAEGRDEAVALSSSAADELRDRLFLVHGGTAQAAGPLHQRVWSRYRQDEHSVAGLLARLRTLAGEMRDALVETNFDALGDLVAEHWAHQREICPPIVDDRTDDIINFGLNHGAAGGKALGAGGGGSVLLVARRREEEGLRQALVRSGFRILDFQFDNYGVYLDKTIQ
jgi:D-glycero-alpha-D-manno-heptose-7-phosphate kinase